MCSCSQLSAAAKTVLTAGKNLGAQRRSLKADLASPMSSVAHAPSWWPAATEMTRAAAVEAPAPAADPARAVVTNNASPAPGAASAWRYEFLLKPVVAQARTPIPQARRRKPRRRQPSPPSTRATTTARHQNRTSNGPSGRRSALRFRTEASGRAASCKASRFGGRRAAVGRGPRPRNALAGERRSQDGSRRRRGDPVDRPR